MASLYVQKLALRVLKTSVNSHIKSCLTITSNEYNSYTTVNLSVTLSSCSVQHMLLSIYFCYLGRLVEWVVAFCQFA